MLQLFAIAGVVIIFLIDYVKAGSQFDPKKNLPWYAFAAAVSLLASFFIEKEVVQYLMLIGLGIAMVHIFKGAIKAGAGTPEAARPMVYSSSLKEPGFMERTFGNPWYGWMVIAAFVSVISFFQINSYWADKNNFNGLFGWLGIGIVAALFAVFFLYKVKTTSTGKGG